MSIPAHYIGQSVKCTACAKQFEAQFLELARDIYAQAQREAIQDYIQAKEAAEEERMRCEAFEAERRRIDSLTSVHDLLTANVGKHYLELDLVTRDVADATLQELLGAESSKWSDLESSVIKLVAAIPGRSEFLTVCHQERLEKLIAESLTATNELRRTIADAVSVLSHNLKGISQGTTISGFTAARALGEQVADDLSE